MRLDDKTTAHRLHRLLIKKGYSISLRTILRCRTALGWTFQGSNYCQRTREVNKGKRLAWARDHFHDSFDDVIWSDKCTVLMERHRRFACRKQGEVPRPKPRPKHPTKVHVWAGISKKGRTGICIFEGIMKKELFVSILDGTLVPFITDVFPKEHRFMQDNDLKHTSRYAADWMKDNSFNWWKIPAESPDINPIENLWHELKEFIRKEAKPTTKDQLIEGIIRFWRTVDVAKCLKYIGHLKKVLPKVIELEGAATGY